MKIAVIKKLAENFSLEELKAAEAAFYEEQEPAIEVEGEDEGEKLTHVLSAIAILEDMATGTEFKTALRNYSQRVRNSLS